MGMSDLFTIGLVFTAMDRVSNVVKGITNNAIQDFTRMQEKLRSMGENMERVGKASMLGGLAVSAPMLDAVKRFADLEQAQTTLKTMVMDQAGKVGPELEQMNALAQKLGVSMPGTTKDMIEGFIALREQGVQAKAILQGVGESAAQFSVIMKMPFASAAEYAAQFRQALGIADKDMTKMR